MVADKEIKIEENIDKIFPLNWQEIPDKGKGQKISRLDNLKRSILESQYALITYFMLSFRSDHTP